MSKITISTTKSQKEEILKKITSDKYLHDEKVWTYLVAHLFEKGSNKEKLDAIRLFTAQHITTAPNELWFEAQPISPRKGTKGKTEGNTHIDLAFGDIEGRGSTKGGIKYKTINDWVCFVEAKLFSDCSTDTTHDPFRNQLSRVIENLVTFQEEDSNIQANTYFTLLTPRIFKEKPFTKLYGYKYFEFHDRMNLRRDFEICKIPERNDSNFTYPSDAEISNRLESLKLNWVTYEEIFKLFLDVDEMITDFHNRIPAKITKSLENLAGSLEEDIKNMRIIKE